MSDDTRHSSHLSDSQQREILAFLMIGTSRRSAVRYVGCTLSSLDRTLRENVEFSNRVRRAERRVETDCLKSLYHAVTQDQQWRAAIWLLERLNPDEFSKRNPGTISAVDFVRMCNTLSDLITTCVPERYRRVLLKELDRMISSLNTDHSVGSDVQDSDERQ
ncbi:MAG: hypothetical protein Q4C47_03905 [Planctomycetia bacterium]|nr:hypothetical protein [Planctomycetia bacterium]